MSRLPVPCLCLVTDRHQCRSMSLEEAVTLAIKGGTNLLQLREKDLPAAALLDLANRLRGITEGRALLFINDRVDVALACGADGVQLGEEALPIQAARRMAGDRLLIGRSVHSAEAALEAESQGADLLVAGTIFASGSHPGAKATGPELLRQISKQAGIPFLAIGGVTAENVGQVLEAGASGAAVISAILASSDQESAARGLAGAMTRAWSARSQGRVEEAV